MYSAVPATGIVSSAALVAALLTIPVAGTALYITDQHLTTRDFSTAGIMLALADALEHRFRRAGIWILAIAAIHPLMAVFGIGLLVCLDRKSTRLNSSHLGISYAVFCLKKK